MFGKRFFLFLVIIFLGLQFISAQSFLENDPDKSGYILRETFQDGSYVIENRIISENGDLVGNDKFFEIGNNRIRLGPGTNGFYKEKGVIEVSGPPRKIFEDGKYFLGFVKGSQENSGDIEIGGLMFEGISDASFVLDENGEIIYADFKSKEGGRYNIDYKNSQFNFDVGKDGRLVFDPTSGIIEGDENTKFSLDQGETEVLQFNGFKAHLDDEGNIDFIELKKGSRFRDSNAEYGSRSDDFKVYFNEPEEGFENVEGEAIFIKDSSRKFKGRVFMQAENGISYEGLGDDSLATFNRDVQGSFNIIRGDVIMKNEVQEVSIIGGRVKIKRDNIGELGGSDFDFSYTGLNGQKYEGFIEGGDYTLLAFGEDGKRYVVGRKNLPVVAGEIVSGGSGFEEELVLRSEDELLSELENIENKISTLRKSDDYEEIAKLSAKRAGIHTELGDVVSKSARNSDAPLIYSVEFSPTQKVSFEVDPVSGRVRGYNYLGERYEIGTNEEIPFINDLSGGSANPHKLIESLIGSQNLGTLSSYVSSIDRTLVAEGVDKGSVLFRVSESAAQEARDYYDQAITYAQSSGQEDLVSQLELKKAITHISSRDYDEAIRQLGQFGEDYPANIRANAELAKAQALLARDPFNNQARVLATIDNSLSIESSSNTKGFLIGLTDSELNKYRSLIFSEVRKTNQQVGSHHGTSTGAWQTTKDTLSIALAPATNSFNVIIGNDAALQIQERNYELAERRFYAVDQAQLLNDKGIDLREYLGSNNLDQFREIYRANGYDSIVQFSELENYGADLDTQSLDQVVNVVSANVNPDTARRFRDAVYDSISQKVNLADSVRSDPTLFTLFTRGQGVEDFVYSGDAQLSEAFHQVRLGEEIGLDYATTAKLNVADALTNPFGLYGASKALSKGAISGVRFFAGETVSDLAAGTVAQVTPVGGILTGVLTGKLNGEDIGDLSKVAKARQGEIADSVGKLDIDEGLSLNTGPRIASRESIENAIGQKSGGTFASNIHEETGVDIAEKFREEMAEAIEMGVEQVKPGNFEELAFDIADRRAFIEDFQGDPRKIGDRIEQGLKNLDPNSNEVAAGYHLSRKGEDRTGRLFNKINAEIDNSFQRADLDYSEALNLQFRLGLFNEEGTNHYQRVLKIGDEEVVQYAVRTTPIGGIYDDDLREGLYLTHFRKEDKNVIARHLSSLHDGISGSNSIQEQARLISEFEWWWFSSNPTLRGGAAIGDSLSMVYQQHAGIPIRNGFVNQDFIAIGTNLDDYVSGRTNELIQSYEGVQPIGQRLIEINR